MGLRSRYRLTPDEAEQLLERQGLREVERWEFGPWHYALVLERRP